MKLATLALSNFRSYKHSRFTFDPHCTIVVGDNGAGKTNMLEAIMLGATGKSFRANREADMIRWGTQLSTVHIGLFDTEDNLALDVVLTHGEVHNRNVRVKKYLVNSVARRQVDFVGNLRAVLFWPEDLDLVLGSPSVRRRYLDSVLVQTDREYRRNLYSYERGLRQRNRLLLALHEGRAHRHQLAFWDELLIRCGGYLTTARADYLEFVNAQTISGARIRAVYNKSIISASRLAQYSKEEIAAKATLVGPHRDDFAIEKEVSAGVSYVPLSSFGSRGEQRMAVLWLKLAQLSFIQFTTGVRPLLLLDDIFSELDSQHRSLVRDLVSRQQTIITSSERAIMDLFAKNTACIDL